jgi:hypothetical protein
MHTDTLPKTSQAAVLCSPRQAANTDQVKPATSFCSARRREPPSNHSPALSILTHAIYAWAHFKQPRDVQSMAACKQTRKQATSGISHLKHRHKQGNSTAIRWLKGLLNQNTTSGPPVSTQSNTEQYGADAPVANNPPWLWHACALYQDGTRRPMRASKRALIYPRATPGKRGSMQMPPGLCFSLVLHSKGSAPDHHQVHGL